MGDNWAKVQSAPIKSISVGPNTVWCLDNDNHLQVRTTVLYCTVLYCTVLYCTVLYCTVLYCTVQPRILAFTGDWIKLALAIATISLALVSDIASTGSEKNTQLDDKLLRC